MSGSFSFATSPHLNFGEGKLSTLPDAIKHFGSDIVLVTGARSFASSSPAQSMLQNLEDNHIRWKHYTVAEEPTPSNIDNAVKAFHPYAPRCVVAIGGGSALDAGKAISAMLPLNERIEDYLEGVGTKSHPGSKIPFIAIPTTSGTGSEATKNAVISARGPMGYKRSLRHNSFVPNLAIVDPMLTVNCPPSITAATGMDAFTQLLESYLSTNANPITDALAVEGLRRTSKSLLTTFLDGSNLEARANMGLAAYLSGITLANAGLGLVHGFASTLGGYFDIPHGVICSALMGPANKVTVRKLRQHKRNPQALWKYALVGKIVSQKENESDDYYTDALLDIIESWTNQMKIPRLSNLGVQHEHFARIIANTDNKNNPVRLEKEEMHEVLEMLR